MSQAVGVNRGLPGRLPRRARMRHKADFERVRSHGRTWRHPLFILAVCQNDQDISRIGLVTSKRIGKAVRRNRARRLLREATRLVYGRLVPGWDIVLIARPPISKAKMQDVYAALIELVHRARLMKVEI